MLPVHVMSFESMLHVLHGNKVIFIVIVIVIVIVISLDWTSLMGLKLVLWRPFQY